MNGVAATHPTMSTTIEAANSANPIQLSSSRPAWMWLRLTSRPVVNTKKTWITMKIRNQTSTRKCSERAVWMLKIVLTRRKRVDNAGDIPRPVIRASGAATKTVMK